MLKLLISLALLTSFPIQADQSVNWLRQYLSIDTVNPPGNESRGVAFLANILEQADIPFETAESAPSRGNIWARLKGGDEPALILLHHIDVVPADAKYWDVPPLSGEIRNDYIYGRGAIDTKGLGIAQLSSFLALKDSGQKLNRDVIFMATADEEAGGFYGAGWLLENRPEIFEGVGYLVNEGGSAMLLDDIPAFNIEVTQKVPLWLRLTATDIPGHGSAPRVTSSVKRILRAGARIADTQFERRVIPAVQAYFAALAPFQAGERQVMMSDISRALDNDAFMFTLQMEEPWRAALLSNTCSLTTLKGSNKINVVPPTAELELDCRLLPDQDPQQFLSELVTIINDDNIEITRIMGFTPAISETDTPLYDAIENSVTKTMENAVLIPSVSTGFTDSHFFRDVDIVSYGFAPFLYLQGETTGVHGNNERISIENLTRGTKIMTDFLFEFATD
ncbi:MAG: M20/M25/M40 family metallo-hydrolase [Gammaproteobacteria bacterium]|jgi:acetylornithine deacetylase/succinyl-diaminopimelate desuccinylase-like protein|nr:M20/M25/M40 family metallo-hydrolase [Gammaproteobacteria bacterium]MBT3870702.1 M20/M25/M40 family metallo-hydrolase [Gammaproteobacteria bacterium]MBT4379094.1 M20/M25/M40 family metallo-hydrolase [Gammaproteobacteria bacterium]MBT4617831.1 M20/M25/M40 family metallo-hydrolase [Gammaproteobacteria bacterium]MBT5198036.1 M20/M25/M40 family metallo-hydrolase [Gammaproteobacteria bacterium]